MKKLEDPCGSPQQSKQFIFKQFEIFKDYKQTSRDQNIYYLPNSPNFASVDAFYAKSAFQMTISHTHPLKYEPLKKLRMHLGLSKLNFFFVVPMEVFDNFCKQNYLNQDNKKKNNISDGYG